MLLETRHLQLISAIATHGTATLASRDLNLTQSAVSHQLINLETRLGMPLFHRLGKRMTLTNAGARLFTAAQRTLGELRDAEHELMMTAAGHTAVLRVSTECYTTYHWMPRIMRMLAQRDPGVEVRIVAEATTDPIAALHAGTIDIAIMMNRYTDKHLRAWPLFDDEVVMVTAVDHPFAARPHIDLHDLITEHVLTYSPLTDGSSSFGLMLRHAGVSPRRVSHIQLTEAIIELVAAGIGVGFLARWAVAPYLARRQVVAVRVTANGIRRRWHAVTLRQLAGGKHIRAFAAMLATGPLVLEQDATRRATRIGGRRATARGAS
jgi:LysR family transcriptional regulator for metE and metH